MNSAIRARIEHSKKKTKVGKRIKASGKKNAVRIKRIG